LRSVSDLPFVIVNPASGSGRTGREWPSIEAGLREVVGDLDVVATTGPRDATRLASDAAARGVGVVIAAGGDGTFSEVAAGVLASGRGSDTRLGLLPLGSGGDLPRTLGIPRSLEAAFAILEAGRTRRVDAGRVECVDRTGRRSVGWFVNEASIGLSADVVAHVHSATKRLGGEVAFAIGAVRTIVRFRAARMLLRIDGKQVHEGATTLVTISNGQFFGGGMQVAPDAVIDDGLFDVVVAPAFSKPLLLGSLLPRIYTGAHLKHPGIDVHRGKRIELEPLDDTEPARVEADGELLGTLPACFEIVPGALRVLAPDEGA